MEAQVEKAIEIAWDPRSDQTLKAQAFDFLNQIRAEPQGWVVCLPLATRQPPASDVVRHSALEIVNNAVQSGRIDDQGMIGIRDNIMDYVRAVYGGLDASTNQDQYSFQNKIAQTFTYLFICLYASQWPTFFDDILALTKTTDLDVRDNATGTSLYLRVVMSIHDEVADVLVSRSSEEHQRDSRLKDLIRGRDIQKLARSWQEILAHYEAKESYITEQCLSVMGRWASWTDLSLIINDLVLNILFRLVSSGLASQDSQASKLRDVSLNTVMEILGKKMKARDKLQLIGVLKLPDMVARLAESPNLQDMRLTAKYDTDLAELVAKLVNHVVFEIVNVLETSSDGDHVFSEANGQLRTFLPYVLRFFSDEYDEICSSVIPCLTELLTFFRKRAKGNSDYASMLPPILETIIAKMKYDETAEWGNEDAQTDEAEFQELRRKLQVLQQAVAVVDELLYIDMISNIVSTSFDAFQNSKGQVDWRNLDLALHEIFLFGQLACKNGAIYSKSKPVSPAAERLISMLYKLVEADIASSTHPTIHLQYMEICVRYSAFFEANPHAIPRTLENFIRFVHHNHVKVKARSWYLFHRFIKHVRLHVGNIAQTVIQSVSDLLPIKAELPEETFDNDDMSSDESDQSADAKFTSQLYLYEAIGSVCSVSSVPIPDQVFYIRSVMTPLFTDLEMHLGPARSGDERATLQVHHLIMALGTLAHGFSEWVPSSISNPPPKEVAEEFSRAAEAILLALESLNTSLEIRTAARAAFTRLVGVLGTKILPQLPRWIDGLLSRTSSRDEMALFLRLLDQVVYGFKSEIFDILNTLLTPFLQRVFEGLAEPTSGTDDEIQLMELKSQYLSFLLVILNNNLGPVLVSSGKSGDHRNTRSLSNLVIENQAVFDPLISTLEHFTKDATHLPTSKLAFSVLSCMIKVWGGPDVVGSDGSTQNSSQPTFPGFDRFMMERFSPLVWMLPSNTNFNPKDAQARQALGEAATMQRTIYAKTGQQYLEYLQETEFKSMGLDQVSMNDYLQALATFDTKKFQQYFKGLIQRLRQ